MTNLLKLSGMLALLAVAAFAAPVNCQFLTPTIGDLMNSPTYVDGCYVQDKLFTNFNYDSGSADNPAEGNVQASFGLTLGLNTPIGDLHEIRFTAIGSSWVSPFSISYTISLFNPTIPGLGINEATFDLVVPSGNTAPTGVKTIQGASNTYVLNASVGSPASQGLALETSLDVLAEIDPNDDAVSAIVDAYTQDIKPSEIIPEPGTSMLLGCGLALAGTLRFLKRK